MARRIFAKNERDAKQTRGLRTLLTHTVIGALLVGSSALAAMPAHGDDIDDQRDNLRNRISQSDSNLRTYQTNVDVAAAAVVSARQQLANAQAALAKARTDLATAQQEDANKAAALATANQALADGRQRVAEGQAAVEAQQHKAAEDMRIAHQQNTAMISIGMFFTESGNAGDVSSRIQWAQTLYNANNAENNRLTQLQFQLQTEQTRLAGLEDAARIAREAAATQLTNTQIAEQQAAAAQAEVTRLLSEKQTAEANAQTVLRDERAKRNAMQADLDAVTRQINQRDAARRAAAAAAANNGGGAPVPAVTGNGFPLYRPVNGPYTSPFAWRTNPVLGYSELHDGLDIGAGCGTPIRAAAAGRILSMGYAGGWGWRVVMDNGVINGIHISTGYNHAQGYIVHAGQWVQRGQVIGYIGTTGLSTGCHLHFHVWANGRVTDPAPYLVGA